MPEKGGNAGMKRIGLRGGCFGVNMEESNAGLSMFPLKQTPLRNMETSRRGNAGLQRMGDYGLSPRLLYSTPKIIRGTITTKASAVKSSQNMTQLLAIFKTFPSISDLISKILTFENI
jgi:hypothetical protein